MNAAPSCTRIHREGAPVVAEGVARYEQHVPIDWVVRCELAPGPNDHELTELLTRVYVDAGFTDAALAAHAFLPKAVRARGDLLTVRDDDDARLIGMIVLVHPSATAQRFAGPNQAELHLLAVDPDRRRGGAGRALVGAALERASNYGYERVLLWTQPAMQVAQSLYVSLGFERVPERDFEYRGRPFLFFERRLTPR